MEKNRYDKRILTAVMASLVATTAVQANSTKAEEASLHLNCSLAEEAPRKELSSLADSSKVYDIDEVVIVSQPKETMRLRQQSLSSTSLGSFQIQKLGTRDLRELSQYIPNFTMPNYGSRLSSAI